MKSYWVPYKKWQLVEWLRNKYPNRNWNKKRKSQLYAIYYQKIGINTDDRRREALSSILIGENNE